MIRPDKYILNDLPVRWRLILTNLILVLVPLIIVWWIFYGRFFGIIERTVLESQQTSSLQVKGNVEAVLSSMYTTIEQIIGNADLDDFLLMRQTDFVSKYPDDDYTLSSLRSFYAVMQSKIDAHGITDIKIYTSAPYINLNYAAAKALDRRDNSVIFDDVKKVDNTYWKGVFDSTDSDELIVPGYMLSSRERLECGDFAVISRFRYFNNARYEEAYIAVYHSQESITESLLETMNIENGSAYIINQWDYLVTSTDETDTGTYMMRYEDLSIRYPGNGNFYRTNIASEDIFISYRDIKDSDWRIVWVIPYASILQESATMITEFIQFYVFFIVIVLLLGLLVSSSLSRRIQLLNRQMQHVETGYPAKLEISAGRDEIGDLISAYNTMAERISVLTEEKITANEEMNSARLQALRAQIEPHFLYNTLDMINWLTRNNRNKEASEAILALSRFYRLSLNKGNLTTTVSDEIEHVSLYVQLMNMRFNGKINYIVDVPDEILDLRIPMIILQPIIENAIQHGIQENKIGSGNISLIAWIEDDAIVFLIVDDGVGMPQELIERLTDAEIRNNRSSGIGIGIYNTHRRIQLSDTNGDQNDYGIFYKSEEGFGTEVTIRVPILEEERKEK